MYKEYYSLTYRVKDLNLEEPIKVTCRDDGALEIYIEGLRNSEEY